MIAHASWPDALAAALERDERAVLVTVADARGSTPREAGAAMIVTATATLGTIGGGHLEHEATRIAREALAPDGEAAATWLVRFPLAARLGQCCGGVATLAFESIARADATWLASARACLKTQAPFALVSRLGGGAAASARLLVTADDARGTLGAADLDSTAVATGRERLALAAGGSGAGIGVVERHGASLFVHVVRPAGFDVFVFGNGHVGRALVHVLGALPARVRWIDAREHDFPAAVPANAEVIATDAPEAELRAAPAGSYVAVMTHSHALDFDLVAAALARDDWRYLGMIGSRAKRAQLAQRLDARGLPAAALERVVCPIGAAPGTTRSKEPGAIAVAVAAEILVHRERAAAGAAAGAAVAR